MINENPQYLKQQLEDSIVDNCLNMVLELVNEGVKQLSNVWVRHPQAYYSGPCFPATDSIHQEDLKDYDIKCLSIGMNEYKKKPKNTFELRIEL